jgi:hypothetical protein
MVAVGWNHDFRTRFRDHWSRLSNLEWHSNLD